MKLFHELGFFHLCFAIMDISLKTLDYGQSTTKCKQ